MSVKVQSTRRKMNAWQKQNHADGMSVGAALAFRWLHFFPTRHYHERLRGAVGNIGPAGLCAPTLDERFAVVRDEGQTPGHWLFEVLTETPAGEVSFNYVHDFWDEFLGKNQGWRIADEDFARGLVTGVAEAMSGILTSDTPPASALGAMEFVAMGMDAGEQARPEFERVGGSDPMAAWEGLAKFCGFQREDEAAATMLYAALAGLSAEAWDSSNEAEFWDELIGELHAEKITHPDFRRGFVYGLAYPG